MLYPSYGKVDFDETLEPEPERMDIMERRDYLELVTLLVNTVDELDNFQYKIETYDTDHSEIDEIEILKRKLRASINTFSSKLGD